MKSNFISFLRHAIRFVLFFCLSASLLACGPALGYRPELSEQIIDNGTYVFHVCRRHPHVSPTASYWYEDGWKTLQTTPMPLLELLESGQARAVFLYDPYAPPESTMFLGVKYDKLPCDKPPPPPPPPPKTVAKAPKKPDVKKAAAKKPEPAKPAPNPPAQKKCLAFVEPGQKRMRQGTASKSCTRILLAPSREREETTAAPAKTPKKIEAPEPARLSDATKRQFKDWGLEPPDVSGLAQERANECLSSMCHARHPGFNPNGKKPEGQRDGQSHSSGGNASSPKSSGKGTTVRTRKSPFSKPREPRLKKDGTPRQKTGPKTEDTAPHNKKVIEERNRLEAEGNKVINGGRKPGNKEEVVKIEGGSKKTRRPDITYDTPDGKRRGINVGKTNADGTPTPREKEALKDLNNHSDRPTDFVPYDR